jgi:hypothetical protein
MIVMRMPPRIMLLGGCVMPGRQSARFAGPLFSLLSPLAGLLLLSAVPSQSVARERLLEDDQPAAATDTRPAAADLRGARDNRRAADRDADMDARDIERDRDRDMDAREARRGGGGSYRDGDRDWFRDPTYYGYGNWPSVEVHDAVVANARAATARALFRRAENALNSSVRHAVRTFEGSDDLRNAQKSEKEAWEAYSTARRRALQSVLENPKYRAIMSLRQELSDQILYKRNNRTYDERTDRQVMDDVMSMATLKMNYAANARAMEQLALETNAEAKDAQTKFRQASARVSDLRKDFDDALRNDRDLLAARRNLEDARIARLTANAYVKGAREAADLAIDFAYYLNRYTRYNGVSYGDYRDYYPYNYGSGGTFTGY